MATHFFIASIYASAYLESIMFFFLISPIRIFASMFKGFAIISSPFSSLSITPELTVNPFSPIARLNRVGHAPVCFSAYQAHLKTPR